jgi:hypothetical protein
LTSEPSGENVDLRGDSSPERSNLTGEQQANRDVGAMQDPHGSAQAAKAERATKALVERVEAEFGFLSSHEVGERIGAKHEDAEDTASRARQEGRLFAIRQNAQICFPAFQLQEDGTPRPVIRALRDMCNVHEWSESDLFLWLVVTTTRFDGDRPVDVMLAEEPAAEQRLLEAAEMHMTAEW